MNSVGKNIRNLRNCNHLSQTKLAERLNVTHQALSQWETGKTQPDLNTLENIADAFHVSIMEVIYGEKKEPKNQQIIRKHLKKLIIYGGLSIIMIFIMIFLKPYLENYAEEHFSLIYSYYLRFVDPLFYLIMTLAALNGVSLLWDFYIKKASIKKWLFIISIVFIFTYYIASLISILCDGAFFTFLYKTSYSIANNAFVFLLPAIGLHLGNKGKR